MHHGKPTKQSPYVPHHNQYCLVFIVVSRIVPRHVLAHDVRCSRRERQHINHCHGHSYSNISYCSGAHAYFILGVFCQAETQGRNRFKFNSGTMDSHKYSALGIY